MFTWVCPTCGRELDVSVKECPTCSGAEQAPPSTLASPDAAPVPAPAPAPAKTAPVAERRPAPTPAAQAFHLTGGQIAAFLLLLVVLAGGAVLLARPGIVDDIRRQFIPDPGPEIQVGRGENDPIEVSGLRFIKGDDDQQVARFVLTNHSPRTQSGVVLEVSVRPLGAPLEEDPAAQFFVAIEEPLEAGAIREAEATLRVAPETALPAWHDLRVDVRRTSGL